MIPTRAEHQTVLVAGLAHHGVLVVDHRPRVWYSVIVVPRKRVIPGARCSVGVAADVDGGQTWARLTDGVRRQSCQGTAQ